jgi:hypothetical protein
MLRIFSPEKSHGFGWERTRDLGYQSQSGLGVFTVRLWLTNNAFGDYVPQNHFMQIIVQAVFFFV